MPIISRPNRDALSHGLDIYRDTMREFILGCFHRMPGPTVEIVRGGLPPERLKRFNDDLKKCDGDLPSALDIPLFPGLVRGLWESVFQTAFDGNSLVQEMLQTIAYSRNRVAHPSTADLEGNYARQRLNDIAYILGLIQAFREQLAVVEILAGREWVTRLDSESSGVGRTRAPQAPAGQYHVYTDLPTRRSRIHRDSCQYYHNRKEQTLDDNYWHGPYVTVADAAEASKSDPDTRWDAAPCGYCLGAVSGVEAGLRCRPVS